MIIESPTNCLDDLNEKFVQKFLAEQEAAVARARQFVRWYHFAKRQGYSIRLYSKGDHCFMSLKRSQTAKRKASSCNCCSL